MTNENIESPPNQFAGAGATPVATHHGRETPVAWLMPEIFSPYTRTWHAKVGEDLLGTVSWGCSVFCDSQNIPRVDKYGVSHYPKPLYDHPPREASPVGREVTDSMVQAAMAAFKYDGPSVGDPSQPIYFQTCMRNALLAALCATFPNGVSGGTER